MTKDDLRSGMILKLTAGKGTYETLRWASLIQVISVNKSKDRVHGIQYRTLAVRNKDCPLYMRFQKGNPVMHQLHDFDEWWDVFNVKVLV